MDEELEAIARRVARRKTIRTAVLIAIGCIVLGSGIYVRFLRPKSPLGGPCRWGMDCGADAPKCMRGSEDGDGVCSHDCLLGSDCAEGIRCVEIELDERDPRGMPIKSGYCFPQSFIDKKRGHGSRDAGPPSDSWLDVPESATQLEGEVTMQGKSYLVKGTLVRALPAAKSTRTIADASGMRIFQVDDEKKTFTVSAVAGDKEAIVNKTPPAKDRVADRDCDLWQLDDGRVKREACVLSGGAFLDPSTRTAPPWLRALAVRGAFPLRVVEYDKSGREVARTAVTGLDQHPVDAALFTIPKSYKNLAR